MFVLDRDPDRRWRPWHIVSAIGRDYIFAACSKVFDVRPKGVTTTGQADPSVVCSLCIAKGGQA